MSNIFDQIAKLKIVPVIAIESSNAAVPLADALSAGRLPIVEITFRTEAAVAVIQQITKERPNMLVGAGTILTPDHLKAAVDSGAQFGVAPGFNPKTVETAQKLGFPFVPGVCTPSEIEGALSLGCKILKFFPAGAIGGLSLLKALIGPYEHTGVRFMPTGGITIDNVADYFVLKAVIACGGTWLATKSDIANNQWPLITTRCREVFDKIVML